MTARNGGITVIDQHLKLGHLDCKRWLFRVWDPKRRSYKSEVWDKLSDGWTWAETKRAELTLGLAVSGTLPLAAIGKEYVENSRDRGVQEKKCKEIQQVVDAVVAFGAVDLLSDGWAAQAHRWLRTAPGFAATRLKSLSPSTRNKRFSFLRWIIQYARDTRRLGHDPFFGYKEFIQPDKSKETLKLDELKLMVSDERRFDPYFMRACLLIYTGRRVQEALHSRWEWIDWSEKQIEVRRHAEYEIKRNKERKIPLQPELAEILWNWPKRPASGWIITDPAARAPNAKSAWFHFRAYLKRCGIIERVLYSKVPDSNERRLSPHSTRHTYIALRLASGESVTQVRREAGHADTKTTDGYADAEASYRPTVDAQRWPRGVLCLRKSATEHRHELSVANGSADIISAPAHLAAPPAPLPALASADR